MDNPIDLFLSQPYVFIVGAILAIGLTVYRQIRYYLNVTVKPLGRQPVQNFSEQVHNLKENPMEVVGIKDTKEVLVFANDLAFIAIESFKGPGAIEVKAVKFITAFLANAKMLEEIQLAANGIENIPAELKDISLAEGIELASVELAELAEHLVK